MADKMMAIAATWSRMFNRRRLTEELIGAFGGMLVGGAAVLFAHRLFGSVSLDVALALIATIALGVTVVVRTRRRSLSADAMARCVDRHLNLGDLLSTAVAIERGEASGAADLAQLVVERARAEAAHIDVSPIGPVRWPWRSTAVAAACVTLFGVADWLGPMARDLITPDTAWARAPEEPAVEPQAPAAELAAPLPDDVREALARDAAALDELARGLGISDDAARALARAKASLETAARPESAGREALNALAGAERELRDLRRKSQRGEHLDPKKLESLSDDALAEALKKATDEGDKAATAALSRELARRISDPSHDPASLARAMRGLRDPAGDKSPGADAPRSGDRALARLARPLDDDNDDSPKGLRSRLNRALEQLQAGQSDAAVAELERMLKQLGRRREPRSSAFDRQLAETLGRTSAARYQQMSGMRGEGTENPCEAASKDPENKEASARCDRMKEHLGLRRCEAGSADPMCAGAGAAGSRMSMGAPMGQSGMRPGEGMRMGQGQMPGGRSMGQMAGQGAAGQAGGRVPGAGKAITRAGGDRSPASPSTAPGGGKGGEGAGHLSPDAPETGAEWLESQWSDSPQGIVRIIERGAFGERSSVDYRNLHESYAAVAENATDREEIPLTRRDYIQSYFEAIRPSQDHAEKPFGK